MRYVAGHKDRTRARVLKEAARAIRVDGPHRIGVAGIMARAGLTHGGFYAHFASKDELVVAAMAQMFDEAVANFERVTGGKPPALALRSYVDFYLSVRHKDARDSSCPLASLAADLPRLDPAARERFGAGLSRLIGAFANLLFALKGSDCEPLAMSVLAEMVGALSLARGVDDPRQSKMILKHARDLLKVRLGI